MTVLRFIRTQRIAFRKNFSNILLGERRLDATLLQPDFSLSPGFGLGDQSSHDFLEPF